MHFRKLTINDIRSETADCVSISFHIPEEWKEEFRFKHGQNITIKFNIGGEELRRSYSICSSPLDNELRIAVKKVLSGRFSTHANLKLTKGDSLEVLPPTGTFLTELNPTHARDYLAFAAGSGITPIISIIKTTLATEPSSTFTLVFGNRNRSSIIFREDIEALKNRYMERFRVYHILSREKTDAPLNQGRIDIGKCLELTRLIDIMKCDEIFICGPEEMIFNVKKFLEDGGIDKRKIHFELFNTPGQKKALTEVHPQAKKYSEGKKADVTIRLDGATLNFVLGYDSFSILDAALKEGADLPYACKGGVCSTCRARLVEGKVEMDANYALEPDEIEGGFVLTCQSHPRSEKVMIDFDTK